MSKHKKSTRKTRAKTYTDVTIHDFANSTTIKHRPKKSSTNVTNVIKQLENEHQKSWDDEELDEYDYVKETNDSGEVTYILKKIKKIEITNEEPSTESGIDYPVDIWFLISEYIKPEDIGTFASICRTSYSVVNTAKFWLSLYKRHYKNLPSLPVRLKPNCMFRVYGIRTLVIKSLFYMYTPFINKLKDIKTEEHPDVLAKRLCVLMWHQKQKNQWVYYFKLKKHMITSTNQTKTNGNGRKYDLSELLDDISANSEEDCRILQITCLNFIPVPPVQGLFLTSVGVTLSQGFRHNRVQLVFNSNVIHRKVNMEGSICILLDPVVNIRVLDWWHPLYPYSYNRNVLMNEDDWNH